MSFLEKLRFNFWDPGDMIISLIDKWEPDSCETEKDYERSLYNFLHNELEEIQVTKQYAVGRIKADLVIGDRVIIEIKNNLNTTGKYQRLIGQISEYREWEGPILIILAGETDQNLNKQLRNFLSKEGLLEGDRVTVIEKSTCSGENQLGY